MLWAIVAGLLLGWIVSLVIGGNRETGPLADLVAGVVGAWIGGLLPALVGESAGFGWGFHPVQFIFGVIGAAVLIALYNVLSGHRTLTH
ncbi:MAG: GlsB/YeaQ/YmgE family stress response membrane protein [Armatimonadota bacterium]|nr:GlsB/YeaQ/YmgE family stress response membrane protein [Armatimonadota bacterium]